MTHANQTYVLSRPIMDSITKYKSWPLWENNNCQTKTLNQFLLAGVTRVPSGLQFKQYELKILCYSDYKIIRFPSFTKMKSFLSVGGAENSDRQV